MLGEMLGLGEKLGDILGDGEGLGLGDKDLRGDMLTDTLGLLEGDILTLDILLGLTDWEVKKDTLGLGGVLGGEIDLLGVNAN